MIAKELEVYAADDPPGDYSLEAEIDGVLASAEEAGFDRFHLAGYSGGGAISIALVSAGHGERLLSLTLMEPAWAGWQISPVERGFWEQFDALSEGDNGPGELMAGFIRLQLQPGVEPPAPPPGPPPSWMASRPAGIEALTKAFRESDIDPEPLRVLPVPVLFTRGSLSADYWPAMAERLGPLFADFTVEVFEGRHHFDPPHLAEPERLAESMAGLWARAAAR